MYYSTIIRSRAGLIALVFTLIISLVSAVPIPTTESGLTATSPPRSNPSLNTQDHHDIQLDTAKISLSGRMSTLPAATRALTHGVRYSLSSYLLVYTGSGLPSLQQHVSTTTNMDDQLVRRNFFSDIGHAFQVCLNFFSLKGNTI